MEKKEANLDSEFPTDITKTPVIASMDYMSGESQDDLIIRSGACAVRLDLSRRNRRTDMYRPQRT